MLTLLAKSPHNGEYVTTIRRSIETPVRLALADTPVVLINGARQTGKTTLAYFQRSSSQWTRTGSGADSC
jgi:predicted AAA+ superfamily ATPase